MQSVLFATQKQGDILNGLYIHIPFCLKKCNYCDFASYPQCLARANEYVDAVCREMQLYIGEKVNTIYYGGGTPTTLNYRQIAKITDSVHKCFKVDADSEITIEANPGTVNSQTAKELYNMGFNRVSLGAQSMIDSELKSLGRLHNAHDTKMAYHIFEEVGFSNISLDLMYAIPNQNLSTLSTSVNQMLKLKPKHISCYGLKIEEGTVFGNMLNRGELTEKSDDEYADMYEFITKTLAENGYNQYELSNFSRSGFESKHNLKYWTLNDYIGLGPSASSCFKGKRFTRTADFDQYLKTFENAEVYTLSNEEKMSEYMILSLRLTQRGAVKKEFEALFGTAIENTFADALKKHLQRGFIKDMGDRYVLSQKAYYISNSVLCDFI